MGAIYGKTHWLLVLAISINFLHPFLNRVFVEGLALLVSLVFSLVFLLREIRNLSKMLFVLLLILAVAALSFQLFGLQGKSSFAYIISTYIVGLLSFAFFSNIFIKPTSVSHGDVLFRVTVFFALFNIGYALVFETGEVRMSGIYENTLNFTGSMCVFYGAAFYETYRKSKFKTLFLMLLFSLIAFESASKSIGLTVLVSCFIMLARYKMGRYLSLVALVGLLSLLFLNFSDVLNSGSNTLRVERYLDGLSHVTFFGIGPEAFSVMGRFSVEYKGIFESFVLSLFLFSPVYFILLLAHILFQSHARNYSLLTPKILFALAPVFTGSILTPTTLLNGLMLLAYINNTKK